MLGPLHVAGKFRTDEAGRDGIVQNARALDGLMGGSSNGYSQGCLAGASGFHSLFSVANSVVSPKAARWLLPGWQARRMKFSQKVRENGDFRANIGA